MTDEQQKYVDHLRAVLPPEMLSERRFMRYFQKPKGNGLTAKIPIGSHSDSSTWSTFDECVAAFENGEQRLGYCMTGGDIHGLDLDHCRNAKTGHICPEAMVTLSRIPSWAEVSVSGNGLHVFFKGEVRGTQLGLQCIQYWHPKKAPRFFALTGQLVGSAFNTLKEVDGEFNYIFSTARHISAKIKEELKTIDPEQWAAMPAEVEAEPVTREKSKTKTRKVVADFDLKDFLSFYGITIDNETENELGHCVRTTTCPFKGAAHVGQNSTSTNFIYPTKDGGLAFHCQSTGCQDYSAADAIKKLAEDHEPYPKPIYEQKSKAEPRKLFLSTSVMSKVAVTVLAWAVDHILLAGALNLFVGDPDIGKTLVVIHYMAQLSQAGKKSVVICREDDYGFVWVPRLWAAGANLDLIIPVHYVGDENDSDYKADWMLDDPTHREFLKQLLIQEKPALCLIDPLGDFAGSKDLNKSGDIRDLTGPLNKIAKETSTAMVVNCHTTKALIDSAIKSAAGSYQLMAAVQVSWLFMKDPDKPEQRLMLQARNKYGKKRGFKYTITGVPYPEEWPGEKDEDGIGKVEFKGKETRTADELLERHQDKENGVKTRIRRWLNEMLANGPVETPTAVEMMRVLGFNVNTVTSVCGEMGVLRDGKTWRLKAKLQAVQEEFDLDGV
jgi:AAA domain